ncbi:malonate decarboxylase holo-ACP synthase [Ancylobacter sp.]|uniref:malonate decarboxylase holo-ACP synthase n=1 Tax=Ancylobacter sp. TaxID=1872567 RepID=UPI003D09A6DC
MELSELRVHDLLRLPSPEAVSVVDPPFWLAGALESAPWVVVRRPPPRERRVAVGIRGISRDQRCAATLDPAGIGERVAPEDLVAREAWRHGQRTGLKVLEVLADLAPMLQQKGLIWGVAGGAGFELATGAPVLTDASDLDLILRCGFPLPEAALLALAGDVTAAPCRIDVLVETPRGGFSLSEFAGASGSVLLRQPDGVRLIAPTELTAPGG